MTPWSILVVALLLSPATVLAQSSAKKGVGFWNGDGSGNQFSRFVDDSAAAGTIIGPPGPIPRTAKSRLSSSP